MNLLFRILFYKLTGLFRKPLRFPETSILKMKVFPTDLDIYGHMNNGRYLTLMDLGRMDWAKRVGLLDTAHRKKWSPLVASIMIRYRRPFQVFDSFNLQTRVVGWDDKWLYLEQQFKRGGVVLSSAVVKCIFRGREGNISMPRLLGELGVDASSGVVPDYLKKWEEVERASKR